MRIAIVHEWLVTLGGSELVLRELLRTFPDASVFTLVDQMSSEQKEFLGLGETSSSFLNRVPGIATHYRSFLPLFPTAVRSLDVSKFDVVISNSHAVAKGIPTRDGQVHLSYCLSPMRYAWDLREQYLEESGLSRGVKGAVVRRILDSLKAWDRENSKDVDEFATLSHYVADRIQRAYGRTSTVIYPPVDTEFFTPSAERGDYYITASRFVPYKRVDLIARAFSLMPEKKLIIVGDGPDAAKVRAAAGPNVTFAGHVNRERLRELLRGAKAFVFAADEDFGIAPVEAQACGVPVVAFGKGGALETVVAGETGVFFGEQTETSITEAIRRLENTHISASVCRGNAERFGEARFRTEFGEFVKASVG
jgi:glycosyltransferase involved in cell wall biosynthesis